MSWFKPSDVGFATRKKLADLGLGARRSSVDHHGAYLPALWLVRDQMHFLGNYSLAIIAVSGLFVGFVFGLQGLPHRSGTARRRLWVCW